MTLKALTAALLLGASLSAAQAEEATKWSGVYLGVHGGYSFADLKINAAPLATIDGLSAEGFRGGLHAGFDMQLPSSPVVVGVFGEYTFGDTEFKVSALGGALTATVEDSWAIGGKAGIAVGSALPYIVAGYTQADGKASLTGVGSASADLKGWFGGGGIEFRLPDTPLSLAGEYRYVMFDDVALGKSASIDPTMHTAMVRLNWRIGDVLK